jgi:hypothetical protein
MNKKGQAAMEFLMTYGWAILVVIAAIAALAYFGVLDPARLMPDRCQFPAGMDCIGKAAIDGGLAAPSADGTVTFALRNNIGFPVDVNNVEITDVPATCTNYEISGDLGATWNPAAAPELLGTELVPPVTINNNARIQVRLSGCDAESGDKYQGSISVSYVDSNTGLDQKAAGEIRGRVA